MRFSIFEHVPWPTGADHSRVLLEATQQVQLAEELGFDGSWLAEHHFSRYGLASASMVLLTHIAAHTTHIRLGTGITVASIRNPMLLAEEAAMLDVLSGGRLDFGVGSGGTPELRGFGIPREESRDRFAEAVEVILGLWTNPTYSHTGQFFTFNNVSVAPKPSQHPHPPLYAAVRSTSSVAFAAKHGLRYMTGVTGNTDQNLSQLNHYTDMMSRHNYSVDLSHIPFFRYVYVAETEEQVRQDTEAPMMWVWDCLDWQVSEGIRTGLGLDEWLRSPRTPSVSYDEIYDKVAFFGTPDKVLNQIIALRDQGVGHFGGSFAFGGQEPAKVAKSMKLFAKEVMPYV